MQEEVIARSDALTPLSKFEESHNIRKTREDIPYEFLGRSPSRYYRLVDMNPAILFKKVAKLFKRVYKTSF
jgi:hypothetical protein